MRTFPFAAVFAITALCAPAASAQQSSNRVAAQTDWSVFVEGSPQECWGVSAPKQTVNTRDGREVSVQRGDILLFVSYRPAQNVSGEISFTGGYPFADGSTVSLEVGGSTFQLITDGQWAWPATPGDDSQIMNALKRGSSAVVTGRSSRGTQTRDTFSLLGFTAASEEAQRRCAG
jgi:hypothetical protein